MTFGKLKLPEIVELSGGAHDPTRKSAQRITSTADDVGAIEVSEAAISLVRNRLLHPIRPELQISATDQARRRIEVCLCCCLRVSLSVGGSPRGDEG